jgi:hypothetical protein
LGTSTFDLGLRPWSTLGTGQDKYLAFIERIKNAMGAMAKGCSNQSSESEFELQEAQSAYIAIFDLENADYFQPFS